MMLTALAPTTTLALSVKRPSLAPTRKRKLSDCRPDDDASPTSLDELAASTSSNSTTSNTTGSTTSSTTSSSNSSTDESSVISPKKKAKASEGGKWAGKSQHQLQHEAEPTEQHEAACEPFAFSGVPAAELEAAELAILAFFLS